VTPSTQEVTASSQEVSASSQEMSASSEATTASSQVTLEKVNLKPSDRYGFSTFAGKWKAND